MQQWTPHVGQTIPLVGSLRTRVLEVGCGELTLGFMDSNGNPAMVTSLASRQPDRTRRAWMFIRSTGDGTHLMVVRCGVGQRIELDERHELRVERSNGSPIKLSLLETTAARKSHGRGAIEHSGACDAVALDWSVGDAM